MCYMYSTVIWRLCLYYPKVVENAIDCTDLAYGEICRSRASDLLCEQDYQTLSFVTFVLPYGPQCALTFKLCTLFPSISTSYCIGRNSSGSTQQYHVLLKFYIESNYIKFTCILLLFCLRKKWRVFASFIL